MHAGEKRLGLLRRGQRLECRLMLAATAMQHTRHHVQQHRDRRVNVCVDDFPTAAEQTLSLLELAHPQGYGAKRPQRGREYRPIVPAIAFGQG